MGAGRRGGKSRAWGCRARPGAGSRTLFRYEGPDGSLVLYGEWSNLAEKGGGCGEWCFRLFPRRACEDSPIEPPAEWARVEEAVKVVQERVAPGRVPGPVRLLADRRF